jgi:hypothetical protein
MYGAEDDEADFHQRHGGGGGGMDLDTNEAGNFYFSRNARVRGPIDYTGRRRGQEHEVGGVKRRAVAPYNPQRDPFSGVIAGGASSRGMEGTTKFVPVRRVDPPTQPGRVPPPPPPTQQPQPMAVPASEPLPAAPPRPPPVDIRPGQVQETVEKKELPKEEEHPNEVRPEPTGAKAAGTQPASVPPKSEASAGAPNQKSKKPSRKERKRNSGSQGTQQQLAGLQSLSAQLQATLKALQKTSQVSQPTGGQAPNQQ